MSEKSAIEWTSTVHPDGTVTPGSSWNPIRGQNARHTCARISPGCTNCYAATMTRRGLMGTAAIDYGTGETPNDPARLDEDVLLQPFKWRKPRKVFVCSMTDLFGTWVPNEWIAAVFGVMADMPQHTFQVLTKRPSRMVDWFSWISTQTADRLEWIERVAQAEKRCGEDRGTRGAEHTVPETIAAITQARAHGVDRPGQFSRRPWPLSNVWIGVSIESDAYVWRANRLRETPAAVRWISAEPLLGGLPSLDLTGISWLVAGGESGPGARPMHPQWARDLRDRCAVSGTAYFFKQWGAWTPDRNGQIQVSRNRWRFETQTFTPDGEHYEPKRPDMMHLPGMTTLYRKGNHLTGRLLDGRAWDDFPVSASVAP